MDVNVLITPALHSSEPDLGGLAELIQFLEPEALSILALSAADGEPPRCWLTVSFGETSDGGDVRARLFREALIALEGQTGSEAVYRNSDPPDLTDWKFLRPRLADGAALPSGKPIAFSIPLAKVSASLFSQAALVGAPFCLSFHLRRAPADASAARPFVPALAELATSSRRTDGLRDTLQDLFETASAGGWYAEEIIGLAPESIAFRSGVERAVLASCAERSPFVTRDILDLEWRPNLPGADAPGSLESLRRSAYVDDLLGCFGHRSITQIPRLVHKTLCSSSSDQPYAFISYPRVHRAFANRVVGSLGASGVRCWMDDGIDPGSVWDEVLEDKIRQCSVLIACVSDAFQNSKYCRREIKFADVLGKPILPVSDGPWSWGPGLALLFQEFQIAPATGTADWQAIEASLRSKVPSVFEPARGAA